MYLFGLGFGGCLHVYRYLSRGTKGVYRKLGDLLLGPAAGLLGFLLLLPVNWGEFRVYLVLAVFLGIISYFYIFKLSKGAGV